jgi:hypothetical protein
MDYDPDQELFFELLAASKQLQQIRQDQKEFNTHIKAIQRWISFVSTEKIQLYKISFPEIFEWIEEV